MNRLRQWVQHQVQRRTWPPPIYLYELYDPVNRLLYVGITTDLSRRVSEHRRLQPWGWEVYRVHSTRLPRRADALAIERQAIQHLHPIHNKRRS